jgi:glycosyltransferase involved in cell wall biosynthesis
VHAHLSHPYFWPHVARGAEREVHDVGAGLAARGHRVDLVTSQPGGLTSRDDVDGIRVRYVREVAPHRLQSRGWRPEECFAFAAGGAALLTRADVALAFHYPDAAGIAAVRRRLPLVLKLTGTVPRDRVADDQVVTRLIRRALDGADEVWVNSQYALESMRGWDREMSVVPAPLDDQRFVPAEARADRPTVLCTAAPEDPRKRVVDLVDAWPAVVDAVPEARLVLAGPSSDSARAALLERLPAEVRGSVSFAGVLSGDDLVQAYGTAWALAMPSVHEALGLVTLEALACGTPVAGARSGATPELLAAPGTGALFEPLDPAGCAEAVVAALSLAEDAATAARCRATVEPFALEGVVMQVEARLRRTAGS